MASQNPNGRVALNVVRMPVDGELFVEPADLKTRHFLRIKPKKHRFPVKLRKLIEIDLELTNPTDEYVAFKFRVTDVDNVRPNPHRGIILPGTTCKVLVYMLADAASPDTHFEDRIVIQSFIAPKGATGEDITPEMFWEESGNVVEEFELRVIYVPADPLVREGSSAWVSFLENGIDLLDILRVSVVGSSARESGVENENRKLDVLHPVTDVGMRQRILQKRPIMA